MKMINGYIEIDGVISKITSVEDLHHVVESLGKDFTDMTKEQLCKLTDKIGDREHSKTDDCGVSYFDGILLWSTKEQKQYKVAEGTKAISRYSFYYNNYGYISINTDYMECPQSLIAIGEKAFYRNRISVCNFSDSIQYIGWEAFYGCSNLCAGQLSLPKDLRYLEAEAFAGCVKIASVVFHDKIKEIGSHAFRGCSALKTAYIPDSVEKVGSGVFDDCPNLESICIPKGTKVKFENLFPFDKDKLVEC